MCAKCLKDPQIEARAICYGDRIVLYSLLVTFNSLGPEKTRVSKQLMKWLVLSTYLCPLPYCVCWSICASVYRHFMKYYKCNNLWIRIRGPLLSKAWCPFCICGERRQHRSIFRGCPHIAIFIKVPYKNRCSCEYPSRTRMSITVLG